MKKYISAILLSFICIIAFAIPKPSEVRAAVESGNFVQAERLLKEVLQEKNTTVIHYQLAQIYSSEGKFKEAVNEFNIAKSMDSSLGFASSTSQFNSKLQNAIDAANPIVHVATPVIVSPPPPAESSGVLIVIFLLIPTIAGVCYLTYLYIKNRAERKKIQIEKDEISKQLVKMIDDLADATLVTKVSTFTPADIKTITDKINDCSTSIRNEMALIKSGSTPSKYTIQRLQNNVDSAIKLSKDGIPKVTPPTPTTAPAPRREGSDTSYNRKKATTNYDNRAQIDRSSNPTYSPAPSTVVVNNSSNNDLLTGVIIGDMMSRNSHSPSPAPVPSYSSRSKSSDDDFDSGRKSSGSSSFDWGSSSDSSSSSSSFDSGSSSSSSSSSDSY